MVGVLVVCIGGGGSCGGGCLRVVGLMIVVSVCN